MNLNNHTHGNNSKKEEFKKLIRKTLGMFAKITSKEIYTTQFFLLFSISYVLL